MIINFSDVVVTSDGKTAELIVPDVVRCWSDLSDHIWRDLPGYKSFKKLLYSMTEASIVDFSVAVYICDSDAAQVSGIASMLTRIARDRHFIEDWCTKLSIMKYKFAWSTVAHKY